MQPQELIFCSGILHFNSAWRFNLVRVLYSVRLTKSVRHFTSLRLFKSVRISNLVIVFKSVYWQQKLTKEFAQRRGSIHSRYPVVQSLVSRSHKNGNLMCRSVFCLAMELLPWATLSNDLVLTFKLVI